MNTTIQLTRTLQPTAKVAAISVSDLSKTYRNGKHETKVLNGVNLEIPRGESVLLAGPSGSGKSTLLSILGCMLSPTSGAVELLGRDVTAFSAQQAALFRRDRIGFIFQRFNLIRGLSALDNVCIPLALQGKDRNQSRAIANDLLGQVELRGLESSPPSRLSGGQCQRVAIARALACNPDLILADEPTASLDAGSGQRIMTLLKSLVQQRGVTLFMVTHDQRMFSFADRILKMENGRIADQSPIGVK